MFSNPSKLLLTALCFGISAEEKGGDLLFSSGLLGRTARLPCDTTPPSRENPLQLAIWFKDPSTDPIYSYDVRVSSAATGSEGKHWCDKFSLGGRALFHPRGNISFLSIESLRDSDRGNYRCRVDFKQAPSKIFKINLEVIVSPTSVVVSTQRGDPLEKYPYNEDAEVILKCTAKGGRPLPRLAWYLNGVPVLGNVTSSIHNHTVTSLLNYGLVQRKDVDTQFTCFAENTNLTKPNATTAILNMNLLPLGVSITSTREPLTANQSTEISCTSFGSRPNANVTWWIDGTQLPMGTHQTTDRGNSSKSILHFLPKISDTGKNLKCRAENPLIIASQIEDSWTLDINYKPGVFMKLGPTLDAENIKEGDDVYFECEIDAKPPIYKTTWIFNGVPLKQNVPAGMFMGNQSLVIQNVARENSGNYVCVGTNAVGPGASQPMKLDIKYKPICSINQKKIYGVARGEIASINCSVSANPYWDLDFRWTFNNTSELSSIEDGRFSREGTTSRLNYSAYHELDYGTILCWASNEMGEQEDPCIIHIIPAGPPEPPKNCKINNSKVGVLSISCEAGFDGGLPQQFKIQYKSGPSPQMNDSSLTPFFRVAGLDHNKTFTISIFSTNSKGSSEVVLLETRTMASQEADINGPITRAAKPSGSQAEPIGTHSQEGETVDGLVVGHGGMKPIAPILGGVITALVLVAIVIGVTMKLKCGRNQTTENTWRKESSESSFDGGGGSPDLLVKDIPDGEFEVRRDSVIKDCSLADKISRSTALSKRFRTSGIHQSLDSLLNVQGLPPPPPVSSTSSLVVDLPFSSLPPPPEWDIPLAPPDAFYTLPRIRRTTLGGIAEVVQDEAKENKGKRSVRFESKDNVRKSNSHIESIV